MFVNTLILVVAVAVVSGQGSQLEQDCHILQSLDDVISRLDSAESDVTNFKSSLTNAEIQVTNLKSSLTSTETQMANLKNSLTTAESKIDQQDMDIATFQDSLTTAESDITTLQYSLTTAATEITSLKDSLISADSKIDHQATQIAALQDSLATAETDIRNLKASQTESPQTPRVLFHVRDRAAQPTANNAILFGTVVENVGDAYNVTSGCFTAPIGGAYWFSSQICTQTNRAISPSLIIRGTMVSRVFVRDEDLGDCGSVTAVATLEVGDIVCLKSGPLQTTDPVWYSNNYITNNFMGVIIN